MKCHEAGATYNRLHAQSALIHMSTRVWDTWVLKYVPKTKIPSPARKLMEKTTQQANTV